MGTRNRERRQAKQKARQQRQRRHQEQAGSVGPDAPLGSASAVTAMVEQTLTEGVQALHVEDEAAVRRRCDALAGGLGAAGRRPVVDAAVTAALQRQVVAAWQRGWQPADLVRIAQRGHGPRHVRVVVDAVVAAMRGYAAATVDERWSAQVRELGTAVWWQRDDGYLTALGEREDLSRPEVVRCALEVLHLLVTCPPIQMLCPLPGAARPDGTGAPRTDGPAVHPRQLDRVRALLAKAESTTFPEEAEAYTAKAQELMARYSIDHALLAAGAGTHAEPVGRRIGVDNPYEAPKVLLLDAVARANRCRSVWSSSLGFATVLGFVSDVDGVELLFTSLLVQATAAMMRAGSHRDALGRSSTRSFRQSFLTAYAQRIGERLTEATRQATEEASRDAAGQPGAGRLLPVLASREARIGALAGELFPELVGRQVAVTNRDGWASGRAAADRAHLHASQPVSAG
ncbi:MAG: hypothetical protein V7603_5880 [Micromonosporaceae bacterium]